MINKNIYNYLKEQQINKAIQKRKIKSATFELLTACNFKCIHCYNQDLKVTYIDYDIFKNVINQLVKLGCEKITLTGGEPLLHPNFKDIYLYCIEKNLKVKLFINGYFIDKHIELLRDFNPQKIEISLYGVSNSTYKKICNVGDGFDKVINNIKLLKLNNIKLQIKTIVMEQNFNEFKEMTKLCQNLNLPFKFDTIILNSKNFTNNQSNNILNENYYNFMQMIKEFKIKNWEQYPLKKQANKTIDLIYKCYAGKQSLFISSNGFARICNFAEFSKKDLRKYSVFEAWQSFEEFLNVKEDKSSQCFNCKYKYCCSNCPVSSYMHNHTDGKSKLPVTQNCREAQFIYESITKKIN